MILFGTGAGLTWQQDIRRHSNWFGNFYRDSDYVIVKVDEAPIDKPKSFKATCVVEGIMRVDSFMPMEGKLLVYFSKDSASQQLRYGDRIIIHKNLQRIRNSGNPGAFDYEQYAAFQQLFHNVFLKNNDWIPLNKNDANVFGQFLINTREKILSVLKNKCSERKDELGIAEALLIGYTNDLDKDLVQAYSNTGVVHIIAISGMHLALIYVMLVWLFARTPVIKRSKILQVIFILGCLWLFSLLTGGAASVLRSATMFTFITIGKNFVRQSSIYNSLAASAFVLLCVNPYYLWDVGFQLSYFAVISIIIFQKPVCNWFFIKNKWLNMIWQLAAVSIAAQILTFPICIYYFHQFPLLFLLANVIVVPLSSLILYVEIALLTFSWVPVVGDLIGKLMSWLVWLMNEFVMWINGLSFAVWDLIPATMLSTAILYVIVVSIGAWLVNKNKMMFRVAIISSLTFVGEHAYQSLRFQLQKKVIVYNVPQHRSIDLVNGNDYQFIGDSVMLDNAVLQNFHLKPARIALQLTRRIDPVEGFYSAGDLIEFGNKKMFLINKPVRIDSMTPKVAVDYIIISNSPKLYIPQLAKVFDCSLYIFDASNSLWKIAKWKADCDALSLHCFSVPEEGAYVCNLE